jgi:hypothetical protein
MTGFTPQQTLIMWHLLGRGGTAPQGEIKPAIDAKDHKGLDDAGLITTHKVKGPKGGRANAFTVTDKGWRWAGDHLGDDLPANYKILQNWLTQLRANLARNGHTLADFFTEAAPGQSANSSAEEPATPAVTVKKPLSATQLRDRIEQAYLSVTHGRKSEIAPLSKVRARLIDLDRATVDAGLLRILQGDEKATLHQISDPKALSREDREAAIKSGGEPYHVLWIQP